MKNTSMFRLLFAVLFLAFLGDCQKDNKDNDDQNQAPQIPSNPIPSSGSEINSLDQILIWQCNDPENDPLKFKIYFGTTSPPPIAVNTTNELSYEAYGLENGTKYYWKVDASDDHNNTTAGTIWDFTTNYADSGTYTDPRDGNIYSIVVIGSQTWMVDNLKYETGNSWCYDNDPANCETYGRLYDWNTIMNGESSSNSIPSGVQGICPPGWHVPGDAEWQKLVSYLGGFLEAGGKMKEAGFEHWASPNAGATNESGFTALPGGRRKTDGSFVQLGEGGIWWSSTDLLGGTSAAVRNVYYDINDVLQYNISKSNGFSLRCLKD